jgi:hypothetical protein
MSISTFPRHDDYDEDYYLLKPAGLRDTHSEGKVSVQWTVKQGTGSREQGAGSRTAIARPWQI